MTRVPRAAAEQSRWSPDRANRGYQAQAWPVVFIYFTSIAINQLEMFFFFSSRRRHTSSYGDWSSDVCSSDLANVALGSAQSFTVSFCPAPTSPIVWDVNGIPGGNATLGTIVSTSATVAQYTAPPNLPSNNPVTVHAVAGGATVSATVTIVSAVTVAVAPSGVSVAITQRVTLTPTVAGTSNTAVTWSVNGIPS